MTKEARFALDLQAAVTARLVKAEIVLVEYLVRGWPRDKSAFRSRSDGIKSRAKEAQSEPVASRATTKI